MAFFKDKRVRTALIISIVMAIVLVVIPLFTGGFKNISDTCSQYIVISTAFVAIIFAALAIKPEGKYIEKLKIPFGLSVFTLFSSIYTYYLNNIINENMNIVTALFGITTTLIFTTILFILIMAADLFAILSIVPEK
jgi:hypothetical protein